VKIRIQSISFVAMLTVVLGMISWGSALHAQTPPQTDQQTQSAPTPDSKPATTQTPGQTPDPAQPPQTPDAAQPSSPNGSTPTAAAPTASDSQSFSGTVVKSGDKYVLKDDSGKTYDIDHQDDVKKFEGKRVKVTGKLDDTGTKILVK